MSPRIENEFTAVKKLAAEFARGRKERASTAHLLAAIAARPGGAADLLAERRLSSEKLLEASSGVGEEQGDGFRDAVQRAREIAHRMAAPAASSAHLLLALLGERKSAAYRCLEQSGVDVSRLRAAAMNLGMGLIKQRRATPRERPLRAESPPPRQPARGVTIPLFPPQPKRTLAGPREPGRTLPVMARPTIEQAPALALATPALAIPLPAPPAAAPPAAAPPSAAAVPAAANLERRPHDRTRFELDPQKFPTLCGLGKNLTLAAARGELDPVVGRDAEVEQTLDVLAKREGNNPLLIGAPGVGKTSVARAVAQRIASAEQVLSLDDRIIVELPVSELLAGTGVRGALASRFLAIKKEVSQSAGRVVLFFDEIHQLFSGDGAEELAGDMKLSLARGELPCIGATTLDEYKKSIESDPALNRRFTAIEVDEPTREDAYLILEALAGHYADHHRVKYSEEALALSVNWSVRYLPGRALPDKAVSIVDLAGARARRRGQRRVAAEGVAEVVAELADMPVERLLETDGQRMLELESMLGSRVIGHEESLGRIARILRRNAAGLGSKRPIGTFLLLGPTGVGKTETAKAIADVLFHSENAMTRIDLSEFHEAHSVARLIGAPPGYVGHEAGGQLSDAVRRRPYQVVLLDEIEKAHPDVLETFLAVFDEGRLTDGRGRAIDFTNTVILMTSNIGAAEVSAGSRRRVGFGNDGESAGETASRYVEAARAALTPELYNRIDEILVFDSLSREHVRRITKKLVEGIAKTLRAQRGVGLEIEDDSVEYLLDAGGFDPTLGARPMKRTLARLVEAPLAERILRGELSAGDVALICVVDGELCVDVLEAADSSSAAE